MIYATCWSCDLINLFVGGVGQTTAEQPGVGELQGQGRGEPLEDQAKPLPYLLGNII